MARNLRFSAGEVDLLMQGKDGRLVIVEVRGRLRERFAPARFLSAAKRRRLYRLGELVFQRYRLPVRVELFEIIGWPPVRWRSYRVEG